MNNYENKFLDLFKHTFDEINSISKTNLCVNITGEKLEVDGIIEFIFQITDDEEKKNIIYKRGYTASIVEMIAYPLGENAYFNTCVDKLIERVIEDFIASGLSHFSKINKIFIKPKI